MDLKKLSRTEQIICGSAIVMLIASFLPWFTASYKGFASTSVNAWSGSVGFFWGIVPTLIALVMLAHIVITHFVEGVKLPDWPWARIHLIGGIAAAVLVILKLLIGIDTGGAAALGVSVSRGIGIFLAALAGLGLAYGGFMYNKEHTSATGADPAL
ncbi:MAG: hypothetical protein QOI47_1387 [Actinomycetota bacterium]|jgi:hypothetical protein|nr:hypothetical protein [Actinomycetota bacterium]